MQNQDFLMRQIETLEELFKKLFSKIFNTNGSEISEASIAEISELLKLVTGLDLNEIANANEEDFLDSLLEKKLNAADMSNLISALVELAQMTSAEELDINANNLARKAIFIETYMMKSQKTVYYGSAGSIEQARNLIDEKK